MNELTPLLDAANRGIGRAVDRIYELLYAELRRIARARLAGAPRLLDTTALVHESYLRLARRQRVAVTTREHFLAYVARAMRSVLVDQARRQRALCRGGELAFVTLPTEPALAAPDDADAGVREALLELAAVDARLARIVELRYYVGLEMEEIAAALDLGKRTVERDWEKARSFLYARLRRG